jgi:hypothetical protein
VFIWDVVKHQILPALALILGTVGGWVLTMGSGQASTYYGEPANLVLGMEMVTRAGLLNTSDYPGIATGPRVISLANTTRWILPPERRPVGVSRLGVLTPYLDTMEAQRSVKGRTPFFARWRQRC